MMMTRSVWKLVGVDCLILSIIDASRIFSCLVLTSGSGFSRLFGDILLLKEVAI
jgi:hypothetical protein